jgi:hypothetical protein
MYGYFLTWTRQICLTPEKKTGKVLLFQSKQGTGKGSLVDWMTKYLFGEACAKNVGVSELTDKFNSVLMNKVFISVDELPTTSEKFHHLFDTLKNLITGHVVNIQFKGKESFTTDNLLNFIFMSNHWAVKIEGSDRRYVVFKINESRVGDHEFWTYLHNEVFTADMAIEFFNYLREMPVEDLHNLNVIPVTELRTKMIENSMNSVEMFLKEVKNREIDDEITVISGASLAINKLGDCLRFFTCCKVHSKYFL